MLLRISHHVIVFLFVFETFAYNLSIIHFNDFHARFEPVNNISTTCEGTHCIGGYSRLYSTIMQLKKNYPYSLLLNAGDNFQGTLWYIVHKWNVTQHFLNKLPLDAITLGNHEFDDGIAGLVPFLESIRAPVVVANIDNTLEPRLEGLYSRSIIIENRGKKIGIIGVLTETTQATSYTENIVIKNEAESVNSEAKKLEYESIFTIIVLSHCGYEADLEIARKSSSKISVIVGGHTDTFLYTGTPVPGPDVPSGPYPTVVLNENGNKVLVVQASAYTKYLGNLSVAYDDYGNVTGWSGAPVFLEADIPTDPDIDAELAIWKEAVDSEGEKIVGETEYTMPNKPCRSEECPLGNFATDAMIYNYSNKGNRRATAAIIHAGGMRAGIEIGNITFNQLTTTFPFQDTINVCTIKGTHLKEILESCMDDIHLKFPHLLQISGLKVIYNISEPEGQRVQSLKKCTNLNCEDIILQDYYDILLPTFLTDTTFNPLFQKYIKNKKVGDRDTDVYVSYLKVKSPLAQKVERRIQIIE